MQSDAERWDSRWADAARPEPGAPDAAVLAGVELPTTGRALDIACGLGANAIWLAIRGLSVDAFDVSAAAIRATSDLAAANDVTVNAVVADFDDGWPSEAAPTYDVVVCQRFRDPRLYQRLAERLNPGGVLVITVLSVVGRADTDSPFLAAPGELDDAFGELDVVFSAEGDGQAHLVGRRRAGNV